MCVRDKTKALPLQAGLREAKWFCWSQNAGWLATQFAADNASKSDEACAQESKCAGLRSNDCVATDNASC